MWKRYSMMGDHRGSKWAWLLSALVVVFGAIAAWKMDTVDKIDARQELSMVKVVVPNMMMTVLDRSIQCLGALGVSDDTPIASMWRNGRALRIADGPDEVHKIVIARRELRKYL